MSMQITYGDLLHDPRGPASGIRRFSAVTTVFGERGSAPATVKETMTTASSSSVWEYQSLYRYLENRFADTVVLTFAQVEALLGFTLPDLARLSPAWWASPEADAIPSSQSRSWIEASRTATANLRAQSVTFERVSN